VTYSVKESFLTLQGEGLQAGRAAVFCRFAGCNLWSGREQDRAGAICTFCDTDFVGTDGPGGGNFPSASVLADHLAQHWLAPGEAARLVVFTGGEPLLQLDAGLIEACHQRGFEVAVETNGTIACPPGVDWLCVSPKAVDRMVLRKGHELKLVYPQPHLEPLLFEDLDFAHFLLQPMDGPDLAANTRRCIDYCLQHPKWRLSIQQHKVLGIR
jgi:7-carboxy-7-deazaguanine synthase